MPDSPTAPHRLLFLFVDGIGLAPAGPDNPLSTTPMPALEALLGGPLTLGSVQRRKDLALQPLDACLGVDGLPQSATGQTALFTGVNAPAHMGRHVAAFPGPQLRGLLRQHSVFKRVAESGGRVTFANPFTPGYFQALAERRRRGHSATTWAYLAAHDEVADEDPASVLRGPEELAADHAVTWDVTRDRFQAALGEDEAPISPVPAPEAGRHLAALAGDHRLTLFDTFLTDLAGHRRFGLEAADALTRIDGLLTGLLAHRPPDVTLLLTSDHGNLEEATHKRHTRNPVPLLTHGPATPHFTQAHKITDLAPLILNLLT